MATHSTARSKRPWHDDEIALLQATYPHHGARAIAPYLGRTEAAVEKKSFQLEILPIRYTAPSPVVIEPLLCARLFNLQVGKMEPLATRCDTPWPAIESYLLSLVFPAAGMGEMEVLFRRCAWEIAEKAAQDGLKRTSAGAAVSQDDHQLDLRPQYVADKGIDWADRTMKATQAAIHGAFRKVVPRPKRYERSELEWTESEDCELIRLVHQLSESLLSDELRRPTSEIRARIKHLKACGRLPRQVPPRKWLPYEDQKVIDYLNRYGVNDVSYSHLAKELNRTPEAIRYHCRKLIATGQIDGSLPPFVLRKEGAT